MNIRLIAAGFLLLAMAACNRQPTTAFLTANKPASGATPLNSYTDSVSYALGINIGQTLRHNGMDTVNTAALAKGLNDYLKKQLTILEPEQSIALVNEHFKTLLDTKSALRKTEEETFLTENKKQAGVITLPSGLQYLILKTGTGDIPTATDIVTLHYHGTFIDGTVFDSSVERGKPVQMPVDRTIRAFTEALQLMPAGSTWKLFVPANLAYGNTGYNAGNSRVEPNQVLVFELQLISITD